MRCDVYKLHLTVYWIWEPGIDIKGGFPENYLLVFNLTFLYNIIVYFNWLIILLCSRLEDLDALIGGFAEEFYQFQSFTTLYSPMKSDVY